MLHNKKGQIGTTMTWIVATIAIFITLLMLVYFSSLLTKNKSVDSDEVETGESSESLMLKKSMMAFLLSEGIYSKLSEDKQFKKSTKELAEKIFVKIYSSKFFVRVGVDEKIIYLGPNPETLFTDIFCALDKKSLCISEKMILKKGNKFRVTLDKK
jgi:hypothetical protein